MGLMIFSHTYFKDLINCYSYHLNEIRNHLMVSFYSHSARY